MPEWMTLARFMQTLKSERAEWDALIARFGDAQLAAPGIEGEWSARDVVAHITWFEREMVDLVRDRALVGSELWRLPTDARNAAIFEQNRNRSTAEVLADARQVYSQLIELLPGLSDQDLNDPTEFQGMPPDWLPWKILADNTYDHYRAHRPAMKAALDMHTPG